MRVIDNYFPDWMVKQVSNELEFMPVRYNNSPYGDFSKARFFGSMLMENNQFIDIKPWSFVDHFNNCVFNDILPNSLGHCHRLLLNAQLPEQHGVYHTDADSDNYMSIIYMGHGNSGATEFKNGDTVDWKLGRMVIFQSNIYHRGCAPIDGWRVSLGGVYPTS
tara:strand:- start:3464 stop:3952 length:489 start_codon:yes stop_codon:yes gene_type:complete